MVISYILSIAYYGVAMFYFGFGLLLLLKPSLVEHKLKACFPVLAAFKYQRVANSINLLGIGIALLLIGNMVLSFSFYGFFIALILSALEVYLGIMFYYIEEKDVFQAVLHFVVHILIVILIGYFVIHHFDTELVKLQNQTATALSAISIWK